MDEFLIDAYVLQRAIKHFLQSLVGDVADGCLEIAVKFLQDGLHLPEYHLVLIFPEGHDASVVDVQFLIGYHLPKVDHVDIPQTLAVGTSALWGVERKVVGCRIGVADTRSGTHETLGEMFDGS